MIADDASLTPPRCKKHTAYDDTRLTPHRCKKHTASFARSTGKFPSTISTRGVRRDTGGGGGGKEQRKFYIYSVKALKYVSNTFIIVTMPFVHTVKSYRRR